ncbi:MAG: ArsR family transcriptional regulator [Promethearchaeota archaeon]|nr:MAG: ArsR family transcriptional regulator [Candidatus Lokiarchaeota archaeon]
MEISESNLPESEIRSPIEIQLKSDFENKIIVINTDDVIELIVKALSSKTRREILRHIQTENDGMDVSNIADKVGMTEANISAQVKKLEEADLIECDYCRGQHGVRKVSKIKYNQLLVKF